MYIDIDYHVRVMIVFFCHSSGTRTFKYIFIFQRFVGLSVWSSLAQSKQVIANRQKVAIIETSFPVNQVLNTTSSHPCKLYYDCNRPGYKLSWLYCPDKPEMNR